MLSDPLVPTISTPQFFYDIQNIQRFYALCQLLDMHANSSLIIFCRTKKDVDHIAEKLTLLNYKVSSYHGDISTASRDRLIKQFKEKQSSILILTDIPNQLDGFPDIDLLLFLSVPQDPDSYIQRIIRLESVIKINEVATLIAPNEFKKIAFIKRVTKSEINQKYFLSPKEIVDFKKKQMLQQLSEYESSEIDDDISNFATHLLSFHSPNKVVSFMLNHGFGGSFLESNYRNIMASSIEVMDASNDKSTSNSQSERLFIAIGKADGIDSQMLVDFLFSETSIEKQNFSDIKIFDTFSFFVVSSDDAEIVLEIFRRKKRGKRSIVERAKGKDVSKKRLNS
jgi:ATP-dependent RNA helicase DeaD